MYGPESHAQDARAEPPRPSPADPANRAPLPGFAHTPIQRLFGRHETEVQPRATRDDGTRDVATAAPGGGAGAPLPATVRAKMEAAFASDFSAVRVHEGGEAAAMGAVAYAHGNDLHFRPGAYDPHGAAGQELIGHELAHVVQQRNGRVQAPAQAKGAPHNADPALEAEADAMGARAARGESTGMASSAGATHAPVIQCYREVPVGGEPWRLSEGGRALAKTAGQGDRTQYLWADAGLIGQANGQLTAAGSFVRVATGPETKRVILRDGGRNAALESEVQLAANARSSGDQDADYLASLNAALERHEPSGVRERAHGLAGGRIDSSREEMEAHYFEALRQRREEVRTTDRTVTLTKVVATFDRAAAPTEPAATYDRITALQTQDGVLYTPSDCNEAARVIMGVSESARDEQPVIDLGTGASPRTPRDIQVAKSSGETTRLEKAGLTAIADAIPAYRVGIRARGLPVPEVEVFEAQADLLLVNAGIGMRALQQIRERAPAVYDGLIRFAKINTAADPAVGDALVTFRLDKSQNDPSRSPRLYRELVNVLVTHLHVDEPGARNILAASQIVETMTYHNMSLALDGLAGALAQRNEGDAQGRATAATEVAATGTAKALWNKHWGGVVMKDGSDFVTLENDASTQGHDTSQQIGTTDTYVNRAWGFAMYGTVQPEQTFHHQMMATEDFGDTATTMTFRRPTVVQVPLTDDDRAVLIAVRDHQLTDPMAISRATELTASRVIQVIKAMKARFSVPTIVAASAAAQQQNLLA
ncbi:MAG TPA: DUF4157 domain-containing protein [Kofleriaceae bacterium]|nr:DUF4157 domain-containing protein [Kofleriaceae bacterium]